MKEHAVHLIICFMISGFVFKPVEAKKLNVVTTLPSMASIIASVGGEEVNVSSITLGAQDAHYVEAKPSYMVKLHKADLLIYSGLELEIGWLPLLIQGARNDRVTVGSAGNLNASLALSAEEILEKPRGEVDRSMGDVHPFGNPHYLLNPYNAIRVAELIADKLIQLDPEHGEHYEQNLDRFKTLLTEKIAEFENQAAPLQGKEVVCYHVHWSYLLDWLKLKPAGYIELRPGIPPTPKHKRDIIELMKERQIKVVIVSSWKEPTKAQEVANAANALMVILPGEVNALDGTDTYIDWINYMVTNLIKAFSTVDVKTQSTGTVRQGVRERGES
jgi:zinc/manganese transport system substrate-binding protein